MVTMKITHDSEDVGLKKQKGSESKSFSVCPKCKKDFIGYPAISRNDNKTEICSNCGIAEALEIWQKQKTSN